MVSPERAKSVFIISGLCVIAFFLLYVSLGSVSISIQQVVHHILTGDSGGSDSVNLIIWRIRMPRAVACVVIGAILGCVGTAFQALFRNPLAEPYVIGVSSGASVGGTTAILLGITGGFGRIGLACIGALVSLGLVLAVARKNGLANLQTIVLGGVVIGSVLAGLTTLNLSLAGQDSGKILFWLLGSTTPMYWDRVALLACCLGLVLVTNMRLARGLNAFAVNEFMAERQGVNIKQLRNTVLIVGTAVTGVAVGTVGVIGFVGLVAPHIARKTIGNDVRRVIPFASMIGASIMLLADILAQRLKPGTELPIGAVTAVIGAPALLWILSKKSQ